VVINRFSCRVFAVRGGQGFSLIESLIAIILLVITLSGGMAFYFNANALYQRNLHARLAVSLAEAKMEQCRSVGASGLPGGICPAETNVSLGVVIQGLQARRTVTATGTTYKDVTVFICWCEPGDTCDASVCNSTSKHYVNLETYVGS
jgi:prepilin-type N-terminal cleavage/methylation domain-containing protein